MVRHPGSPPYLGSQAYILEQAPARSTLDTYVIYYAYYGIVTDPGRLRKGRLRVS